MADAAAARLLGSSGRTPGTRRQTSIRNSSARSSAVYSDEHLQPQGYGSLGLRSTTSRFSLNEQFAATRREIDFGFDDSASTFDQITIASQGVPQAVGEQEGDSSVDDGQGTANGVLSTLQGTGRDVYNILCLSHDCSPQEIRLEYYRLFAVLSPDTHPLKLRQTANLYFSLVQAAFETLIEPGRRLTYDLSLVDDNIDAIFVERQRYGRRYGPMIRDPSVNLGTFHDYAELEIGTQLAARGPLSRPALSKTAFPFKPLDFAMRQSFSAPLPELQALLDRILQTRPSADLPGPSIPSGRQASGYIARYAEENPSCHRTVLSVRASIYGFLQDIASIPASILADPYQPNIPTYLSRDRALQLLDGRVQPLVAVSIQHQLATHSTRSQGDTGKRIVDLHCPEALLEVGTILLPEPAVIFGLRNQISTSGDREPISIYVTSQVPLWRRGLPRAGISLQRRFHDGYLQCNVESGDWAVKSDQTCQAFTQFSRINRKFLSLDHPLQLPPKIELEYHTRGPFQAAEPSYSSRRTGEDGLRGLEWDLDTGAQGSWTISTRADPHNAGVSLRYGINLSILSSIHSLFNKGPSRPQTRRSLGRDIRIEAEVSTSTLWPRFLALRCLRRFGRLSRAGFEVGLGARDDLHLSLYWSPRPGQRLCLPILIGGPATSPRAFLWAALVPLAGLALWEYVGRWLRDGAQRRRRNQEQQQQQFLVQRRRAEADDVTTLLLSAGVVSARQEAERSAGGLVVLSAKYGVKAPAGGGDASSWGLEEVADVTVAVAALVVGGRLRIPAGVDKGEILGFWDPVPGATKTCHVRYLYQGREATVEVSGRDELVLPPRL